MSFWEEASGRRDWLAHKLSGQFTAPAPLSQLHENQVGRAPDRSFFQKRDKNMLLPKVSSGDQCDFNYIFLELSKALKQKIHLIRNKNKQTIPQRMSLNAMEKAKSMKNERF